MAATAEIPDAETPRLLTVPEAARFCGVSRATAWRKVRSGEMPAVRIGNGSGPIRVPLDELHAWVFGEPEPPESEPESLDELLEPEEVARRLGVTVGWVKAQRFSLACVIEARTAELRGVRVRELEHWERAARAAFPSHPGGIGANG